MTICNMSIEAGARAGMIAPDETTFAYLEGRPAAPTGVDWERALDRWRALPSDPDATYDHVVEIDVRELAPQVTWGTNPGMVVPVDGVVPDPADMRRPGRAGGSGARARLHGPRGRARRSRTSSSTASSSAPARTRASRTCARRRPSSQASASMRACGRMVVPGLGPVKRQAEEEGLDRDLRGGGLRVARAGCSMCLGMNPDILQPGERCASTSNRNFEGRQGRGGRTHLVSPAMAAAAALAGHFVDVRELSLEPVA